MTVRPIDRRDSACPQPVPLDGRESTFLHLRKPEDGMAHNIQVGDFVVFRSRVSGADVQHPTGLVTSVEVVREDCGRGEEVYARFYVTKLCPRTGTRREDPCGGYGEVCGVQSIQEVVEDPAPGLAAKAEATARFMAFLDGQLKDAAMGL